MLAGDTPPEPWTPADSIAVLKGMAMQLSGNAFTEAARVQLIAVLGRRGVQDFFAPFSDAPLPAYLDMLYGTTQTGEAYGVPDITASDNWAVDGAHSVTGKPLLANDPHLGFSIPSVWYLAHLNFGDEDIIGGTLAGFPPSSPGAIAMSPGVRPIPDPIRRTFISSGSIPTTGANIRCRAAGPSSKPGSEIIKVRFGADRRVLLRSTRHGPVMPETTQLGAAAPSGYVAALAWTALAPDDTTFDAVLGIDRAKSAAEVKAAAKFFVTPMQNIVYADDWALSG